jgi:outer membrane protein G
MKKSIVLVFLCLSFLSNAQAFRGKKDMKFQIGFNMQEHANGIHASIDKGLAENISVGLAGTFLLSTNNYLGGSKPYAKDLMDIKARFNANIGDVLGLKPKMDVYPGLDLSLKNFGGHLGFRWFFSSGFGVYAEAGLPIKYYRRTVENYTYFNNQFYTNIGASFNL